MGGCWRGDGLGTGGEGFKLVGGFVGFLDGWVGVMMCLMPGELG